MKYDIFRGDTEYVIVIDLPGMVKEDLHVSRQNVVTLIEGDRKRSKFDLNMSEKQYEKSERKFGNFALTFKIPDEYERRWYYLEMENGVLCIKYKKDSDTTNNPDA